MICEQYLKVAIAEDDPAIAAFLEYNLSKNGYEVTLFSDGESLIQYMKSSIIDIALLDWMLPGISGAEVCLKIRENPDTKDIPIIIITARSEEHDKILGLENGADDYITKPFSVKELLARIKAICKRCGIGNREILTYGNITIDLQSMTAKMAGRYLKIGLKEFNLLLFFVENPEKVFTREQIIKRVWGNSELVSHRTVDVNINRLRNALAACCESGEQPLHTVRSMGYSLRISDQMAEN